MHQLKKVIFGACALVMSSAWFFAADAAPLTITNPFSSVRNFGPSFFGPATEMMVVGAQISPSGSSTTAVATQGSTTLLLRFGGSPTLPNNYVGNIPYSSALTGAWSITAMNGADSAGPVLTNVVPFVETIPLVSNLAILNDGSTPTLTWTLPNLTGFTVNTVLVTVYDSNGSAQDIFNLGAGATSFTLPATEPTAPLIPGVQYYFQVTLGYYDPAYGLIDDSETFTQSAFSVPPACFFPSEQTFSATGGLGSFRVSAGANCSGFATTTDGWIGLLPGRFVPCRTAACPNFQLPGGGVNFSVAKNTSTASRTGHISINDNIFTITQSGVSPVCTFSVSPVSRPVSATGGTVTERVIASSSSCDWTATVDAGSAGAMSVASGAVGSGNGLVQLIVSSNPGTTSRALTATIAQQSISLLQGGSAPALICGAINVSDSVRQHFVFSGGWWDLNGIYSYNETAYITNVTRSTLTNVYYVVRSLVGSPGTSTSCFGQPSSYMVSLGDIEPGQTVNTTVFLYDGCFYFFDSAPICGPSPFSDWQTVVLSGRPNQ
jgi:hypothetical protein